MGRKKGLTKRFKQEVEKTAAAEGYLTFVDSHEATFTLGLFF